MTYIRLRLVASQRPKWASAAEARVIAKAAYANCLTLNGTVGITSARTPRILATVSSTLRYGGNPRWTKAPSGPLGKGKWSLKTKLTMLNSITASTSPVLVRYNARSRLVSVRPDSMIDTISSRFSRRRAPLACAGACDLNALQTRLASGSACDMRLHGRASLLPNERDESPVIHILELAPVKKTRMLISRIVNSLLLLGWVRRWLLTPSSATRDSWTATKP